MNHQASPLLNLVVLKALTNTSKQARCSGCTGSRRDTKQQLQRLLLLDKESGMVFERAPGGAEGCERQVSAVVCNMIWLHINTASLIHPSIHSSTTSQSLSSARQQTKVNFQIMASTVRGHLGMADLELVVSREGFLRERYELQLTEGNWPGRELEE